jgi:hypothetical protein
MAVWGRFPFDNRILSPDGTKATWAWAMAQWDLVAAAGHAVRLVIAGQDYARIDLSVAPGDGHRSEAAAKFSACREAEQLVFGQVYAGGGKLSLGVVGQKFDDPLRPGRQVPGVADQIASWRNLYGSQIDGIYVDSGPTDCTNPAFPASEPGIPANYLDYVSDIRRHGYLVFLQAAQYPDEQHWLQDRQAEFLELWEAGVAPYSTKYQAKDACHPDQTGTVPTWWDPGPESRWSRVHVINDCRDAETMRKAATLAIDKRGTTTVWITRPRQDPTLGTVYDTLPPYWNDEVAFFKRFADQEDKDYKDGKDNKDEPDRAQAAAKDLKDQKEAKEAQEAKDSKDGKDGKDDPDQAAKDTKDAKDEPDKTKEDPKEDEALTEKQETDLKGFKDGNDKQPEFLKDSEVTNKGLESAGLPAESRGLPADFDADPALNAPAVAEGRTFIRPDERPAVGERIVAGPPESQA